MRWVGLIWLGLLAGCVTQPGGSSASAGRNGDVASAKVHTELAALYFERGQYGIALEETAIAIRAVESYAPAYVMRGLVRMALREDVEAEKDFRTGIRLDAHSSEAHNNYGWFLCQRGREKESIPEFIEAVKNPLYETPEKALVNAGMCSRKMGNNRDAEDFLLRALQVRPQQPEALIALAELEFDRGDWAGAKSYFMRHEQAASAPLTAANLWLALRIERKLGNGGAAEGYARQLRRLYPEARETQLMLYADQ
jgi:type IV pilus assembly protein PilF